MPTLWGLTSLFLDGTSGNQTLKYTKPRAPESIHDHDSNDHVFTLILSVYLYIQIEKPLAVLNVQIYVQFMQPYLSFPNEVAWLQPGKIEGTEGDSVWILLYMIINIYWYNGFIIVLDLFLMSN